MKRLLLALLCAALLVGCVTTKPPPAPLPAQEVVLRIEGVENVKVNPDGVLNLGISPGTLKTWYYEKCLEIETGQSQKPPQEAVEAKRPICLQCGIRPVEMNGGYIKEICRSCRRQNALLKLECPHCGHLN